MKSNQQQVGCPTFMRDVVSRVLAIMNSGHTGIFNCVNTGSASRFDYVSEIVRLSGESVVVQPADAAIFNRRAKVSDNEAAVNWRMTQLGFDPVWFGVIVVMAVTFGMICPPVGMNVFVISSIARDIPLSAIYRGTMPFIAADIVRLLVLCAFPGLTLWLPRMMA